MKVYERSNAISGETIDADIPTRWLLSSVVVNKDGSMGVGWRIQAPYLRTMGEDAKVGLHGALRSMLNSLPPQFDVQFLFSQHHDARALADAIAEGAPTQPVLREIIRSRADSFKERFGRHQLRFLECYVILVRKNTIYRHTLRDRAVDESMKRKGLFDQGGVTAAFERFCAKVMFTFGGADDMARMSVAEYEHARGELLSIADSVDGTLATCGLSPAVLSNEDVLNLFYAHWNPQSYDAGSRARKFNPGEVIPITEHFVRSPWEARSDGLFVSDGVYNAILTVRTPPETMQFTQWDNLLLSAGEHRLRLIVNVQQGNVERRKKLLKDKLPLMQAQAEKDPSFVPVVQDVETELLDLGRDAERVWNVTQVIHVWGPTPEDVWRSIREVKKYGESMDGLIISEETHAAWEYWRASQPFWTRDADRNRDHIYNTTQLVTQLPVVGQPTAVGPRLGAVYETIAGTVFNFFLHDDQEFANYSALVIGGSGVGKSFLVNDIVAQMARHDPRVVIIDLGGSFRGMCAAQGGSYVEMDLKSAENRMNPLFVSDGMMPNEEQLNAMLLFLEKLIVDPVKEGRLAKEQVSVLEQALTQTFMRAEGKEIFLSNLKDTLSAFSGGSVMASRLAPWTGTGRYAKLFDGPSRMDMSARFVVFDLTKVVDNPDLCPVMFATIIQHVMSLGPRYPKDLKFLAFDECWKLLQDEIVASFVVEAFRALRKSGFSTVGISQGIEEFAGTKNKTAIINNISHLVVLRQNSDTAARLLAQEFRLNDAETEITTKLQSRPGQYSQSLIRQTLSNGTQRSVITVNRPSPLSYWCCTTKPADRGAIEELKAKGMSHLDALVELSRLHPNGVFGQTQQQRVA